jgi:hypothetical protein
MVVGGVEMKAVSSFRRRCLWSNTGTMSHGPWIYYEGVCEYMKYNRPSSRSIPECYITKNSHEPIQGGQEGFEIAFHGHVSFGERCDMAEDSRRNLLLLSSSEGSICIKRLGYSPRTGERAGHARLGEAGGGRPV